MLGFTPSTGAFGASKISAPKISRKKQEIQREVIINI
jgi:hypothetical protein